MRLTTRRRSERSIRGPDVCCQAHLEPTLGPAMPCALGGNSRRLWGLCALTVRRERHDESHYQQDKDSHKY